MLAPVRVARSTWPDEAAKWEHLRAIEVQPVVGDLAERTQALAQVAHNKVDRFMELTGTPSPNGLKDLWGQGQASTSGRTRSA